ncbi:MAG: hypothetical protein LUE21_11225 [Oscillospiraceae bacterium]|nr:hypothetical protein [Oscillospiraceae bacterium]
MTRVTTTYLRKKACSEAEDETVTETPATEYAGQITELTEFLLWLLGEREKLFAAIRAAKSGLPLDIDSETSLNASRQEAVRVLKHMADLRPNEVTVANGGLGYRFNADGNQVSYKCDIRKVTTINFDRNAVKKRAAALARRADEISAEIDRCVVNAPVDYTPPFDVNDSFADVFEAFTGQVRP